MGESTIKKRYQGAIGQYNVVKVPMAVANAYKYVN